MFQRGLTPLCERRHKAKLKLKLGFTIIELVMTLVLISIVAVVAIPASLPISANTRAYYTVRQIRSDIRYAQLLAMEQAQQNSIPFVPRTRVVFYTSTFNPPGPPWIGYQLEQEVSLNTWDVLTHPATRTGYIVKLNEGNYKDVSITAIGLSGGNVVIFDSYGRPYISGVSGVAPLTESAFVDLNNKYRLNFRTQTGKVDITNL